MAFEVIDSDNITATANAYITVQQFKDYHNDRGGVISTYGNSAIQKAIVKATDYLDQRFSFVGGRRTTDQRVSWPRVDAYDSEGYLLSGIPVPVEEATAEYAFIALTTTLNPTPEIDAHGRNIKRIKEKVDVIEVDVTFLGGSLQLPEYPVADLKLKVRGLIVSKRGLVRGG